jgi:2-polyprenyl-6-hydroxyphenyl methylase/3-demethylubiquinone-9 3-methyltransferase
MATPADHEWEVASGERFRFGENWSRYLNLISGVRIEQACQSLESWLGPLQGKSFLDVGCGSGLFSLAARRVGALVHSFDYDPESVACATSLRRMFCPDDPGWIIEHGSVLDQDYLHSIGQFDVVYAWGVLHHTGSMWRALNNVVELVKPGGQLYIAIYNDQGKASRGWKKIKRFYNHQGKSVRLFLAGYYCTKLWWRRWLKDLLFLRPFDSWRREGAARGMSAWTDVIDWVGGYPFEVAKPCEILRFFVARDFHAEDM